MFDQSYGLRFDIYERIVLAEDLPGIEELEEAELIPHIQVISQEEQATLRGHLLLAGLYKGDTEQQETEPLEHWIPVEITVPLNRVSSIEDIAVEIENFDVDLLSKRSLNITGVLSLKGIQAAVPSAPEGLWTEEEITVVHAPDAPSEPSGYEPRKEAEAFDAGPYVQSADPQTTAGYEAEPASVYGAYHSYVEEQLHTERAEEAQPDQVLEVPASVTNDAPAGVWNFDRHPAAEAVQEEPPAEPYPGITDRQNESLETSMTAETNEESAEASESVESEVAMSALEQEEQAPPEEPAKPELKVAFTNKHSTVDPPASVGFSSLLQSSRTVQASESQDTRDEEVQEESAAEAAPSEDVQWKSLFLGSRQEDKPFRKVRLCIVQREETLDAIAERYQMSPRELLLYNRLSEQHVEEGQILYIP